MKKERRRFAIILVIGFFAALATLGFSRATFFENIEHRLTDFRFSVRGVDEERMESSKIVVVAIDDQSFAALGRWPWPRTHHAKLVENLKRAGAKTIVFDVEFTEPSGTDPSQDDALRAAVAKAGNVVLAGKMIVERSEKFSRREPLPPIKKFVEVATFGIVNTDFDSDGFVRRYRLYMDHEQSKTRYFSLGIAVLVRYLGLKGDPSKYFRETAGGDFVLGDLYRIKRYDDLPSSLIPYYGPAKSFKTISYEQVVDDEGLKSLMDRNTLKDKIVLVGATASELHDLFPTPFYIVKGEEILTPGVEIHANFIQSVLDQKFIFHVTDLPVYFLTFFFALLVAFVIKKTKPIVGITTPIALGGAYLAANALLFAVSGRLMGLLTPLWGLGLAYAGCNAYQFLSESKEKLVIRNAFRHYLAPNVVESVLKDPDRLTFGGEKKHLTVLFSDIRNFTKYCENHTSEQVLAVLGEYLTAMVEEVYRFEGMLDKFIGDAVMAVFGAPNPMEDHAEMACRTALEMRRTFDKLTEKWKGEGRDPFEGIGIGINTEDMHVGNFGSRQLFDYTVIGSPVNLASRLEGVNKLYETANNIVISEFTRKELPEDLVCRELELVRVKGQQRPVAIFELLGEKGVFVYPPEFLELYGEGLGAYKRREFEKAHSLFKQSLLHRDDERSRTFMKRCRHFSKNPPGKDWDGVFTLTTK